MKMSPLILFCGECGAANTVDATVCAACQQPFQPSAPVRSAPPTPRLPLQISSGQLPPVTLLNSRYEILREVGQGGYSVVYVAKDVRRKNKRVAIKQINLRSLSPRQMIEATDTFNREVMLLSKFKHASLPRIYEHFTDADHWYLVMEYIEGETLEEYLQKTRNGALPVKEALALGIQLCQVLAVLHRQEPPIIFRDVKPSNIMRTPRGRLYLIDFGIARHFTPGKNKDTQPLGSPGYAAPEQYGKAQTTAQSDIYSLGATLSELLTGHDPLDASPVATSGQPVPPGLHQLLDSMLEHDASKRPKSMKEVQWKLKHIKQGIWGTLFSYILGFLWASLPYPLLLLLYFIQTSPQFSSNFTLNLIASTIYGPLIFVWPFVTLMHVITAVRYLWVPSKRWMGLGMLTILVLLAAAIFAQWPALSVLFSSWNH